MYRENNILLIWNKKNSFKGVLKNVWTAKDAKGIN